MHLLPHSLNGTESTWHHLLLISLYIPSKVLYKSHLSGQWIVYQSDVVGVAPTGFSGLGKDIHKTRRKTFRLGFGAAYIRGLTVYSSDICSWPRDSGVFVAFTIKYFWGWRKRNGYVSTATKHENTSRLYTFAGMYCKQWTSATAMICYLDFKKLKVI